MAIELSHSILWLFAISTLIFIAGESIYQQAWKAIKFTMPIREVMQFLVVVGLVEVALFALSTVQHSDLKSSLYFLGAAIVPFILTRLQIPSSVIGLVILGSLFGLKLLVGESVSVDTEVYVVLGLAVFKTFENFFVSKPLRFDDVAAPLLWIAGTLWYGSSNFDLQVANQVDGINLERNILLAGISIAYLIKLIRQFSGPADKFFIKSLVLSAAGGLGLYFVLQKLLMSTENPEHLALFYAGGMFASSLLNAPREDGEEYSKLDHSIQFLVLVGILTLVATRLFGNFGLLLAGASCLSAYFSGSALTAALFFAARALFQVYEVDHNANVTGINLMHSYVGASQYAGVLLSFLAALLLVRQAGTWRTSTLFLGLSLLVGPLSNYFLHEEPTSSVLVSILSTSIIIIGLAPAIFKGAKTKMVDTLSLLPFYATSTAMIAAPLIELGESSSLHDRILAAAWVAGAVALLGIFAQIVGKSKESSPPAKAIQEG